jgi:hypothetical protein
MGSYPRQYFVYGFFVDEEPEGIDLYDWCEENGLSYECAYDGYGVGIAPFAKEWIEIMGETYLGGYYVSKFDLDKFNKWFESAKTTLTDEKVKLLKETFSIDEDEKPALWTISNYG